MKTSKGLSLFPLIASACLAHAQQSPTPADSAAAARANALQDQQLQQQRDAAERERALNTPVVRSTTPSAGPYPELPTEHPCFPIESFVLDVPPGLPRAVRVEGASALPQDRFAFAREWLDHYNRGYVTTRVLVPEQDLTGGTLRLSLVPGVIRRLRFADPATRGTWRSAFPARSGDVLNLRDLEQGLEQMKRVPSQDVEMQIEPTETPGESDVVISVKRAKPWSVVASVDNSGQRATGKLQGNLSLGIDNPLGLNDLFNIGANQDLEFDDKRLGSHGWNGSYSVPWGYWTGTLFGYTNTYYQQIAGVNTTFVSSGNAQTAGFKLQRVLRRSQDDVLGAELGRKLYRGHRDSAAVP